MIQGWDKIVSRVAKDIFTGKQKGTLSEEMIDTHAKYLIIEMFGRSAFSEPIGINDPELAQITRDNIYIFSGAKNYQQLKEFNALMHKEDGTQKQFREFLKDVKVVDKTYNQNYLKAEHNQALGSARIMQKWQQVVAQSRALPYLKYRAVMDGKTRDTHKALNGIIKRWDDPFWDANMPLKDWNCRCTILQLANGEVTPEADTPKIEHNPLFKGNVGKTGIVFPEKHPYFDIPKKDLKTVRDNSTALSRKAAKEVKPIKLKQLFKSKKTKATVQTDVAEIGHSGYIDNVKTAKILADQLSYNSKIVLSQKGSGDALLQRNGQWELWEFKVNNKPTYRAIDEELKQGKKQSRNILIRIESKIKPSDLYEAVHNRLKNTKSVDFIIFIWKGKTYEYSIENIKNGVYKNQIK
jgi:SPP1 gp7 family putative phage head morphogenesis protein